jgi:hypothetical protein
MNSAPFVSIQQSKKRGVLFRCPRVYRELPLVDSVFRLTKVLFVLRAIVASSAHPARIGSFFYGTQHGTA